MTSLHEDPKPGADRVAAGTASDVPGQPGGVASPGLTGGCHCGAVRYRATSAPQRHSLCHCTDCRRSAGAPVVAWAIFEQAAVELTQGRPRVRASSAHGRRHFCGDCGTGLFYTNEQVFQGLIDVQSATLDEPEAIPTPDCQVQVAERIGWLPAAVLTPAFERYPGG